MESCGPEEHEKLIILTIPTQYQPSLTTNNVLKNFAYTYEGKNQKKKRI